MILTDFIEGKSQKYIKGQNFVPRCHSRGQTGDKNVENIAEYAAKCVKEQIVTGSNTRGSAEYRNHLAGVLVRRAVCKFGE